MLSEIDKQIRALAVLLTNSINEKEEQANVAEDLEVQLQVSKEKIVLIQHEIEKKKKKLMEFETTFDLKEQKITKLEQNISKQEELILKLQKNLKQINIPTYSNNKKSLERDKMVQNLRKEIEKAKEVSKEQRDTITSLSEEINELKMKRRLK